ncbi:MAG: YhgE/Pip domain-containing protein [Inconstantimicrobium porci]|uniref:YhgE/Pip domain-containing protein n=1 Tax=Inconstantimicrobium porci TaxID=2652291 RepID=UPI002A909BC3|nr:YhgE/Pip domain-containing protein [Inconstantimicrobium porci]MDY5910784.1 YhgE/Pip domain-containing protein [Inconstantimicrobium porci]
MKLFNVCKKESKTLWKNKIKIVATLAVIIIPLLYTFSYLKAYWDPYGDLKNYHVAIINNDTGATLDGKKVNYGNETIDKLKKKTEIGFDFVDKNTAEHGLKYDKYFASIEIPNDFSKKIVEAKDGSAVAPTINFVSNNKKNYIATKISENIKTTIISQLKQSISEEYAETAFSSIYESKDGLKDAATGTDKLIDGTGKLSDGNNKLTSGLKEINSQVPKLQDGVSALSNGASALNTGLGKLNGTVPALASPINQLASGASTLNNGVNSALNGSNALNSKSGDLVNGINSAAEAYDKQLVAGYKNKLVPGIKNGADQLSAGAQQLNDSVKSLPDQTQQLANGASLIDTGVKALVSQTAESQQALQNASKYLEAYIQSNPQAMADPNMAAYVKTMKALSSAADNPDTQKNIKKLTDGTAELKNGTAKLNEGSKSLSAGTAQLAAGTKQLSNQLDLNDENSAVSQFNAGLTSYKAKAIAPLQSGIKQYTDGVGQLHGGLNALADGSAKISGGLGTLNSKIPTLSEASQKLYDGSAALSNGINQLGSKIPALASGTKQLENGSVTLGEGLTTLNDGQNELKTGLNDGIEKISTKLKTPSKDLGKFVGSPVDVKTTNIDEVSNYGSGLAPYFLPISLWLGAVLMMLIIKIKNENFTDLNRFDFVIGKYLNYAILGIVQALCLGGVVYALNITPKHPALLFISLIITALSFDAILYALVSLFGLIGEGLSIVILVLQLCSDAGTFPMELLPSFFQNISTFLPFTYVVEISREVLFASNINMSLVIKDLLILGLFALISLILAFTFSKQGIAVNESIEDALDGNYSDDYQAKTYKKAVNE